MSIKYVIGWDLGGAHLKAACLATDGVVHNVMQVACPLWEGLDRLQDALRQVCIEMPTESSMHAITMTGECVDLFLSRSRGVQTLVELILQHTNASKSYLFAGKKGFLTPDAALDNVQHIASANWLASAVLTADNLAEGLFIDVGSTTTDVVLFCDGQILVRGYNDYDRLRFEELVYTGVVRTPIMALAERVPFKGAWVRLMAENFSTTADIYRLTNALPKHGDLMPSADRCGKTKHDSARRLARMLGKDVENASLSDWQHVASFLVERQLNFIREACENNISRGLISDTAPCVGAGIGRFLVRELSLRLRRPYVDFNEFFAVYKKTNHDYDMADLAPAVAVAGLALKLVSGGGVKPKGMNI